MSISKNVNNNFPSQTALDYLSQYEEDLTPLTIEGLPEYRDQIIAFNQASIARTKKNFSLHIEHKSLLGLKYLEVHIKGENPDYRILHCFGGGFISGNAEQELAIAARLAQSTNSIVIIPDYPLAPEFPYPIAVNLVFPLYLHIASQGSFSLSGESAGGNMALQLLALAKMENTKLPNSIGLLSPWCDLSDTNGREEFSGGSDPTCKEFRLEQAAKLYAGDKDRNSAEISPIHMDFDPSYPPFFITTATHDQLLLDCIRLTQKIHLAGGSPTLRIWEKLCHVFEFYDQLPESEASLEEIGTFITIHKKQT